uniref:Uncharacterized protein n=1 Tax=Zea mays TaxID=4577 RepID=A0A804PXX9_MAIZE
MALVGVVGIGITKRPSQQCLDAVESAARRAEAEEGTVEQNTPPWMATKKVTALAAICLVALPILMVTTVSRRDVPRTPASFWPLATLARQACRRPARAGVRRAVVPQPLPVRVLPQEPGAVAVRAPHQAAAPARGAAAPVRPGHRGVQGRGGAAQIVVAPQWQQRRQRHPRRLQVPGAGAVPGAREQDPGRGVGVPLRRARRPRPAPRRRDVAGRRLLRAVPGDVVAAAAAVPDRRPPEPDGRRAGELREPGAAERQRGGGGGVRAPVRVRGPRPLVHVPRQALLLRRRRAAVPPARGVAGDEDGRVLRAGAVPEPGVPGRARRDVPSEGLGVLPPGALPVPPDERGLGAGDEVPQVVPEGLGRKAGHPGEGVRRRRPVPAHPGPDPRLHFAGTPAPRRGGDARAVGGPRRAVQGRPDDRPQLVVLREDTVEVLAVGDGHRRGRERVPAEPRGAPALRLHDARHEGGGGDVPAGHDRQDRHQRLVDVRLRRARPRRAHAVDHVQA